MQCNHYCTYNGITLSWRQQCNKNMESLTMDTLPDDELMQVFSYLPVVALLGCRAVCRRWRKLALHPHLWRRLSTRDATQLHWAALRLAPCVRRLTIGSYVNMTSSCRANLVHSALLAADTQCAAAELALEILDTPMLVVCTLAVRRQAALGRLRQVKIYLQLRGTRDSGCIPALLQEVQAVKGLVKLELDGVLPSSIPALPKTAVLDRGAVEPCLIHFKFNFLDASVGRHQLPFLADHLATLEKIETRSHHPELAALVSNALRLRKLACPLLDNMMALKVCPSLTSLHLHCFKDDSPQGASRRAAVSAYLRVATSTKLTRLKLQFYAYGDAPEHAALLQSVAGESATPRPSTLRCLALDFCSNDEDRLCAKDFPPLELRPLAAVLDRLTSLRHLSLVAAPADAFLDAISPEALPELVKLKVYSLEDCSHEWFHSSAVTGVLKRNPRLHLVIEMCGCSELLRELFPETEDCTFCAEDCRPRCPDHFWKVGGKAVFFSHLETEKCGLMEIHKPVSTGLQWMKV
ncbi:uncharacterized protein LOC117654264 isoform X3 [Thrips palmi]|uniref:Uncharacterized protein LOC117654264 isoform X3 n=1 Tax=Thrips palmi TaxID=161013 RepID=A0A6P9AE84_THRPL|nr:uncharacterized protein LOC117654264 isoform X3 [Thrips palmi]